MSVLPTPRDLDRSSLLNALGEGVPLAVGLLALPRIVHGLGTDAFGAFQLAWLLLGTFALFDLGLGRATTRFVATLLARGEGRAVPALVRTALLLQTAVGAAAGAGLALLAPSLARRVFAVPPDLVPAVITAFRLLALVVPVVLLSTALGGILQATQRFGSLNLVRGVVGTLTYAAPVAVLTAGGELVAVVATLVVVRVAALPVWFALGFAALPRAGAAAMTAGQLRALLTYGGWMAVLNVIRPLMSSLDRIVLGILASLEAVGYYGAPADVIARLSIVPAIIVPPVFAAAAAADGAGAPDALRQYAHRARGQLLWLLVPIGVLGVLAMRPALAWWLGADFAEAATPAARILVAAAVLSGLAQLASAVLEGTGRPDLPARFHLLELPVFALALVVLVPRFGLAGAAAAVAGRAALDAALLHWAAHRRLAA